ncbi:VWA domain-containing protein [Microbispora amethystogenes]|uniref:VWFA domain-containing protein n=1 Tax=Microbispora amethystogenes TaxID=1427754 RepID=A0ABQ4FN95_9ACTN|nr:vWA domain-containing protein [Microbispora amethystogenes]GIH36248.1 hypothetical protein Mam01_64120 [Microbispora amethystogenes]
MNELEITVDRERVVGGDEFAVGVKPPAQRPDPAQRHDTSTGSEFVLALDASASMTWPARRGDDGGPTRWDLARKGALALVAGLAPTTELHILMFAGGTRVVAVGSAGTISAQLENLLPVHLEEDYTGTSIEAALIDSYAILESSTATSRRVILLSDGEPTTGNLSPDYLAGLAERAVAADVYIDPIGLGAEAKVDLLLRLAVNGPCDHVASREDAEKIMVEVMSRLAQKGQQVIVSGGELRLEVSPHFSLLGVYQLAPARRIHQPQIVPGEQGSSVATVPLGAFGAGEHARPLFALKLRAPAVRKGNTVPVVQASATLRSRRGVVTCPTQVPCVLVMPGPRSRNEPRPQYNPYLLDTIREVELEAETAERLTAAPEGRHEEIYRAAKDEATSAGLYMLAGQYSEALKALGSGLKANDVYNFTRAASSRGVSSPVLGLRDRPVLSPSERARPVALDPVYSDDDWQDEQPGRGDGATTDYGDEW